MIDMVLAAVIVLSAVLGFVRGFVGIVVGLLSWLLAGWAAFQFGHDAAQAWAAPDPPGTGHLLGGYLGVFLAVMLVVSLLGLLIRGALRLALLGGVDRLLGGVLGVLRGGLICAVLLLMAGFTSMPADPAWHQSRLRPLLQPLAAWMQAQLPDVSHPLDPLQQALPDGLPSALPTGLADSLQGGLGKPAATGDNGVLGEVVAGRGWPRTVDPARGAAGEHANAPALPANIDPAQSRPDEPDPPRNGPPGQAWPPSL